MYTIKTIVTGRDRAMARVSSIKARAPQQVRQLASDAAKLMQAAIRDEAPVRRGRTKASITYRTSSAQESIRVKFSGAWWTHFITKGTRGHDIWAGFYTGKSDKRFLFFDGSPAGRVVHHPGARANDFVRRAYARSLAPIQYLIRVAGASLMGR